MKIPTLIYFINACYKSNCERLIHVCFIFCLVLPCLMEMFKLSHLVKMTDFSLETYNILDFSKHLVQFNPGHLHP